MQCNFLFMMSSDQLYECFYTAFEKANNDYGRGFKAFLGANEWISAEYVGMLLNKTRTASIEKQKSIAKACGYQYEDFLKWGKDILQGKTEQKTNSVVSIEQTSKSHHLLIDKFQDKEAGKEANKYLVELEKLDIREFYKVIGEIKGLVMGLKQKKAQTTPTPRKTGTEQ